MLMLRAALGGLFLRWLLCASLLVAVTANAAPQRRKRPPPVVLRTDLRIDLTLTLVGGLAWVSSEVAKADLVGGRGCGLCEGLGSGQVTVNPLDAAVRRALLDAHPERPHQASNVLGFVLAPLAALGLDALAAGDAHRLRGYPTDLLLIAQATVAAADLNQLVKYLVRRPRPYVAFAAGAPPADRDPADANLSFYSGHTSFAFALAASAGTVATLRRYRLAPLVWSVGLAVAATTAALRIAAERHYLIDVLAGAVGGTVLGVGLPFAHRLSANPRLHVGFTPLPVTAGAGIALAGRW